MGYREFIGLGLKLLLYKYEEVKYFDKGRVLETWIKQGNKWLLIGSLSSSCDTPPNCPHVW